MKTNLQIISKTTAVLQLIYKKTTLPIHSSMLCRRKWLILKVTLSAKKSWAEETGHSRKNSN